jgi:hypothetical protein
MYCKNITITVYSTPAIKRALQTENTKINMTYVSCYPTILVHNVLFTRILVTFPNCAQHIFMEYLQNLR